MKIKLFILFFAAHLALTNSVSEAFQDAQTTLVPTCKTITGTAAVTFTTDHGKTLAATAEPLRGIGYTYGLTALDVPDTLLAVHNTHLIRSTDGGCGWTSIGEIQPDGDYFPLQLAASVGNRAYGWSANRRLLARIDSTTVTYLKSPTEAVSGVGPDPKSDDHARLVGDNGVWDSTDGGRSWTNIGALPATGALLYEAEFDPKNLDHVLIGTAVAGAFVTFDGGRTWTQSTGFSPSGKANVFNVEISPAKSSVVWAMGLDLAQAGSRDARHIYRSEDGGKSFVAVVDESAEVTLVNGPTMAPHPKNHNILYFVFGTFFQDYGTDLFRYHAKKKKLTKTHNGNDDINAITFSRTDPSVMYLGLEVEER